MNLTLRCVVALAAFGVGTCAAAEPVNKFTTVVQATETPVKKLVLPLSATSSLVVTPCPSCAPQTHAVTAATQYFINKNAVTLQELRAAVADKPDLILTVAFTVKTGELVSITADLPYQAAAPTRRR